MDIARLKVGQLIKEPSGTVYKVLEIKADYIVAMPQYTEIDPNSAKKVTFDDFALGWFTTANEP